MERHELVLNTTTGLIIYTIVAVTKWTVHLDTTDPSTTPEISLSYIAMWS
jgi:hypothetical protein